MGGNVVDDQFWANVKATVRRYEQVSSSRWAIKLAEIADVHSQRRHRLECGGDEPLQALEDLGRRRAGVERSRGREPANRPNARTACRRTLCCEVCEVHICLTLKLIGVAAPPSHHGTL